MLLMLCNVPNIAQDIMPQTGIYRLLDIWDQVSVSRFDRPDGRGSPQETPTSLEL